MFKFSVWVIVSGMHVAFLLGLMERLGCVKLSDGSFSLISECLISSITAKGELMVGDTKSKEVTFLSDSRIWALT